MHPEARKTLGCFEKAKKLSSQIIVCLFFLDDYGSSICKFYVKPGGAWWQQAQCIHNVCITHTTFKNLIASFGS